MSVALSAIRADLGFAPSSLSWVANACTLAFAGFLLLPGAPARSAPGARSAPSAQRRSR
nr:hypothetical protein [Streptomyces melanosporofaciens]